MRVLITGGAGNIARYCLPELQENGHDVTLFARQPAERTRNPWTPDAPTLLGDLTSPEDCARVVAEAKPDAILHHGAMTYATDDPGVEQATVAAGHAAPPADATLRVNLLGTYNVLRAARDAGVPRFVHGSSVSVLYGSADLPARVERLPVDEDHPTWATDSYGLSKRLNEQMLDAFSRAHGLQTTALRIDWVFFPHAPQGFEMVNPTLGREVPDDATDFAWTEEWQYVDARDVALACRLACEHDAPGSCETYFVSTDRQTTLEHRELLRRFHPRHAAWADAMEADDLCISIRRIRERLGYVPRHSWRGEAAGERVR